MNRRVFVTDCEGPISKNDNALELTIHYVPQGDTFFTILSRYDDVLAYLENRPGYSAGYTLKIVAPFLKVYGATDQGIEDYSRSHIVLIEDAKETLHYISNLLPTNIVSTSYKQYIEALCKAVDFPVTNTFSTNLNLDKFRFSELEITRLRELKDQIIQLPEILIPEGSKSVKDLPAEVRTTVERLDEVFFSELPSMSAGKLLEDVRPIGSRQKMEVLMKIRKRYGVSLDGLMYVGDSITDVEAFRKVRKARGLTVSFNGNHYAIREAEIAVISKSALVIALLAEVFAKRGREGVSDLAENWPDAISEASKEISRRLLAHKEAPKVTKITRKNMRGLIEESTSFRKNLRGQAIGSLG